MIETTETLIWAILFFTTSLGVGGKEVTTYSAPSFHMTYEKCIADGERLLSVIDLKKGVKVRFACIPREMLRKDLAMHPPINGQH
jgi:hypothetical protein